MAKKGFTYAATASQCPGALNTQPGWYSGTTLIAGTYTNPATGLAYTPQELGTLPGAGGTTPAATPGTPAPVGGGVPPPSGPIPSFNEWVQTAHPEVWAQGEVTDYEQYEQLNTEYVNWANTQGQAIGGAAPTTTAPPTVTMPTFGETGIPGPEVIPAPAYEITPEQQEMQDLLGTQLTDWVKAEGYGLSPEVQAQMIQQQTDALKARETEAIRVMRNNMERRGITNSGYVQANVNMIASNTTIAIAGAIADVQIKSALMKMASFEKAMGAGAQFLGYLSEQSQLAYKPEFATWQAEQLATMQKWQAEVDLLKMAINQAYQTQNIQLQADLTSQLAEQTHGYDVQLAEMALEAELKAAQATGAGQLMGSASGLVASFIAK